MSEPYHHVRFRWWEKADIDKIAEELGANYDVNTKHHPRDKTELSLHKDDRDELIVSADTLTAHLSGFRAVMSQRSAAKFKERSEVHSQGRGPEGEGAPDIHPRQADALPLELLTRDQVRGRAVAQVKNRSSKAL